MAELKLIYFEGCPNVEKVRRNLAATGYPFDVVRQDDLPSDHPMKSYSSPTILKGSEIIFGSATGLQGGGCSLDIPSTSELQTQLGGKNEARKAGVIAQIGSIASAITVGFCPICIPAIGAFLSAVGLGFLVRESVLKPVLIAFLLLTVGGLYWSYRKEHRNILPFLFGALLALALYISRYVYLGSRLNSILMWGSITGIVAVSVWNLTLRKSGACAACATNVSEADQTGRGTHDNSLARLPIRHGDNRRSISNRS